MRHYGLGKNVVVDFVAGKMQLVLFHWSSNTLATDVKMYGPVLEEKLSFRMLVFSFCSKLGCWGLLLHYLCC